MDGEVRFTIRDESGEEQEIKVRISNEPTGQIESISWLNEN